MINMFGALPAGVVASVLEPEHPVIDIDASVDTISSGDENSK